MYHPRNLRSKYFGDEISSAVIYAHHQAAQNESRLLGIGL